MSSSPSGEKITFTSGSPRNYFDAITNLADIEPVEISGDLFLPEGDGPFPAIIIVPGSLGLQEHHLATARRFTEMGIAAFAIDPFKARSVTSTVANQAQYSFAASAMDVISAIECLAKRAEIDNSRIGAQGHSRGGSAVLTAASKCFNRVFSAPELCGVYAAYPWCGHQFRNPDIGKTKIRAVIGDQDEWCLPQQVQAHIHAMQVSGGEASIRIVSGAHHSFDRRTPLVNIEDASVAPGAPTIYLAENGAMYHPLSDIPSPDLMDRETMLYGIKAGYGVRGAHLGGGDEGAADIFEEDMLAFWEETLRS